MFQECLANLPAGVGTFLPAPSVADQRAWERVPHDIKARLNSAAEAALHTGWSIIPTSAYLDYTRNGNRTRFETLYFARRRMLNALILAECVEAKGRYLDAIVDGIMLICEESGWQLPAHNAYERGGSRLPLPDIDRPVIDLFAAETGAQLAVAASLLGPALKGVSPEVVARIDRELDRRIATPYLTTHFWWMGNGDEPMNNWTAWCTQNVLLTVLVRNPDPAIRRAIVEKATTSLDAFLKDYAEDGACEEGADYYRHAGLCLFGALNILSSVAPDAFAKLWSEPKIKNIADYIVNAHIDGRRYFNFADCSAVSERCGAREFLFGLATGSNQLADFAASDWSDCATPELPEEINLYYRLQSVFTAEKMRSHGRREVKKGDIFYPSIGLLIARDDRFDLAVKAGDNGDSHNHNDVGSVVLYKNKRPFLIDVGVESYTAKTFSPRRYEIWTMQSAFHNLPSFGGVMQEAGEEFCARDVVVSLTDAEASIEMDIADAYPPAAGVRHYRREVRLVKGDAVEIEDLFDGDLPGSLSLMFCEEPTFLNDTINVEGLGSIAIEGASSFEVETITIDDTRLRAAWPERIFRVRLDFSGPRLLLRIT